jgi:hypothetical protein
MNRFVTCQIFSALTTALLLSSAASSAHAANLTTGAAGGPVCSPACPNGQVCKWAASGNGETICSSDVIVLSPCGLDRLCASDHGRRKGPRSFKR